MSENNGLTKVSADTSSQTSEEKRLEALFKYEALDTVSEEEFDDIARLAGMICQTPISLFNLIDEERQRAKAAIGLDVEEVPREEWVCKYTILDEKPLQMKQRQLENANHHKDEILRVVSHDMRNPLTGIIGISDLIRSEGFEDSAELDHMMELIEKSARHLLENSIELTVCDDGIGILKECQHESFQRNHNYKRQGTSGEKSTGRGLPLLENLVLAHNGSITLDSEPNKGSIFAILLPELTTQTEYAS